MVHLNDSQYGLGSRRDRHTHIGEGHIGQAGLAPLLTDSRLAGLAGIIETPKSDDLHEDRQNLARLRRLLTWDTSYSQQAHQGYLMIQRGRR